MFFGFNSITPTFSVEGCWCRRGCWCSFLWPSKCAHPPESPCPPQPVALGHLGGPVGGEDTFLEKPCWSPRSPVCPPLCDPHSSCLLCHAVPGPQTPTSPHVSTFSHVPPSLTTSPHVSCCPLTPVLPCSPACPDMLPCTHHTIMGLLCPHMHLPYIPPVPLHFPKCLRVPCMLPTPFTHPTKPPACPQWSPVPVP